jgi:hypothetical protein
VLLAVQSGGGGAAPVSRGVIGCAGCHPSTAEAVAGDASGGARWRCGRKRCAAPSTIGGVVGREHELSGSKSSACTVTRGEFPRG